MVFWKNFFPDFCYYVVQVDIPPFTDWSITKPGMEIFITDKHGKPVAGNSDSNFEMAFLNPHPLKGSKGKVLFIKFYFSVTNFSSMIELLLRRTLVRLVLYSADWRTKVEMLNYFSWLKK